MELTILWTDFAKAELKKIFDYHTKEVNVKTARQIIHKIVKSTDELCRFPEMGARENLLIERPQDFRYLVSTNYKIIYWINPKMNQIEVVDVFDTRQNPPKMKRKK
jgi:addiction module RelE/StbE family toxin